MYAPLQSMSTHVTLCKKVKNGSLKLRYDLGCAGEDVGHYGGSYKVTYDLYKKYGEWRLLDTPICGECGSHNCCHPWQEFTNNDSIM